MTGMHALLQAIGRWRQTRKSLKFLDKMRLVIISAHQRDFRPVDIPRMPDKMQGVLESHQPAIPFRRHADFMLEKPDELLGAQVQRPDCIPDRLQMREMAKSPQCMFNQGIRLPAAIHACDQILFENAKPLHQRGGMQQLFTQKGGIQSPQIIQRQNQISRFAGGRPQKRDRLSGLELYTHHHAPVSIVHDKKIRTGAAYDRGLKSGEPAVPVVDLHAIVLEIDNQLKRSFGKIQFFRSRRIAA